MQAITAIQSANKADPVSAKRHTGRCESTIQVPSTLVDYFGHEDLPVTFWPPLYEQRRGWVLDILRRERVTSLLDVGCGEGTLLRCLCNPSPFLLQSRDQEHNEECHNENAKEITPEINIQEEKIIPGNIEDSEMLELHISHLAGLDISESDLKDCIVTTAPREVRFGLTRWEPLEVKIWHGSFDIINEKFVNIECIVSTEVIEHLPPPLLPSFALVLLGIYRPRLFLITTPNYAFNARFAPPWSVDKEGFPDPTGRTNRVFRHHDHKFEWTVDEFRSWCKDEAKKWGYIVEVAGIGAPQEKDPWSRDEQLGCATQVALFKRKDKDVISASEKNERETALREHREQSKAELDDNSKMELVATHIHAAHPQARLPRSISEIHPIMVKEMQEYYTEDGWTIWELWMSEAISASCGGYINLLFETIGGSSELLLAKRDDKPPIEWRVKFKGEKHAELVAKSEVKQRVWKEDALEKLDYPGCSKCESPENPPTTEAQIRPWEDQNANTTLGGLTVECDTTPSRPLGDAEAPVVSWRQTDPWGGETDETWGASDYE